MTPDLRPDGSVLTGRDGLGVPASREEDGRSPPLRSGSGCQPSASAAVPEEWRDVVGYEGLYEVSSLGRVRSRYAINGHVLSTAGTDKDGYPVVSLSGPDGRHTFTLHRLVCRAFHGPPNPLHREAAHLDGDRTNARADNLKWVSKGENHFHMRAHGTHPAGERNAKAKLTEADVHAIRLRGAAGEGAAKISRDYPTTRHAIQNVLNGRNWRHVQ